MYILLPTVRMYKPGDSCSRPAQPVQMDPATMNEPTLEERKKDIVYLSQLDILGSDRNLDVCNVCYRLPSTQLIRLEQAHLCADGRWAFEVCAECKKSIPREPHCGVCKAYMPSHYLIRLESGFECPETGCWQYEVCDDCAGNTNSPDGESWRFATE